MLHLKLLSVLLCLVFLITVIQPSSAHISAEGKSVGNYKIEFGTLPESPIIGENTIFSVSFENATSGLPILNQSFWLRLSSMDKVLFSSKDLFAGDKGPAFISYNFMEAGDYEAKVEFYSGDEPLSVDFTFTVAGRPDFNYMYIVIFAAGLIAGFFIRKFLKRATNQNL